LAHSRKWGVYISINIEMVLGIMYLEGVHRQGILTSLIDAFCLRHSY